MGGGVLRLMNQTGYTPLHVITVAIAAGLAVAGMAFNQTGAVLPIVGMIVGGVYGNANSSQKGKDP